MFRKIDQFLSNFKESYGEINNEFIRLYATGVFQKLNNAEKDELVNYIYINYALFLNIVPPDLEKFYLEKSMSLYGSKDMMDALIDHEFRNVVVCGSFKKFMKYMDDIITNLNKMDVKVLSPWSTNISQESREDEFVLFEGEKLKNERDTWRLKYAHMDKFRQSDAIIVCNPNGYIGEGTIFELGFMAALSKRIIFTEKPKDLTILFPYEVGIN